MERRSAPKGHAESDLLRPLRDGEGDHGVDAQRGQQQSEGGEGDHGGRAQTLAPERQREIGIHRRNTIQRDRRIDVRNGALELWRN